MGVRLYTGQAIEQLPAGEPGEGPCNPLARAAGIRLWWRDTDLDGIPFAIFFLADGEHGFGNDSPERQLIGDAAEFVRRFQRGRYPHLWTGEDPLPPSFVVGEMRGFHHLGDTPPAIAEQAQIHLAINDAYRRFDELAGRDTRDQSPDDSWPPDDDGPF